MSSGVDLVNNSRSKISSSDEFSFGWLRKIGFVALFTSALVINNEASAAIVTWDGGGADNTWAANSSGSKNENWSGNEKPPVNGDSLEFSGTARLTSSNNISNLSVSGINFTTTAGAFTLSGNSLTLSGQIINNSTNFQTINMALGLNATQTLNAASGNIVIGGIMSGVGGIIKAGVNLLTLNAANTYTGATTVTAGILKAGVASVANVSGAFGNNSAVTLSNTSGVALDITGYNTQIGSLTGGGTSGGNVTLGAATLTVGGDNTSPAAYAGVISGTGGVTKIGSGTQILTRANTYSGATIVSSGALMANNSSGSATGTGSVTVQTGANLGGSGTVSGATAIAGNLNPGNNVGVMTFGSSLVLQSTATTFMDIDGVTRGTHYDGINVGSSLTYGGALVLDFGVVFGSGQTFNLFDFASRSGSFSAVTLTGSYNGSLVNKGSGIWGLTSGNNTWTFTQSTGDLQLAVIPEPSAAMLSGLGIMLLLLHRRRF